MPNSHIAHTSNTDVTLLASGYNWLCPECEVDNHEEEANLMVVCTNCRTAFTVGDMLHNNCETDGKAQSRHEQGVADCRSPRLGRRQVTDDLSEPEEDGFHDFNDDLLRCARCGMNDNDAEFQDCPGRFVADDLSEPCGHTSTEDHLFCNDCGRCRESLDDADVCGPCREER